MQACPSFQVSSSEVTLAEYQLGKHPELNRSGTAVTWNSALQLEEKWVSAKVCSLDSVFSATETSHFFQHYTFCGAGE